MTRLRCAILDDYLNVALTVAVLAAELTLVWRYRAAFAPMLQARAMAGTAAAPSVPVQASTRTFSDAA